MDLDEVADELYAELPEEFVALRKARQDEAKDDGDRVLATQIGALPKPSAAAWVCNLLVRAHRDEIEGLVELGTLLRDAQESLAGNELKALNKQRSQLLAALSRQAAALAREQGRPVSSAVSGQVEETLRAAMTEPDAGEALLSGRLTSPMSYHGMGTVTGRPDLRLVRQPKPDTGPPAKQQPRGDAAERRRAREEADRQAAQERRRQELAEARQAADDTTARAEEAQVEADDQRRRVDQLDARRTDLQARVTELADELARAEQEATEVAAEFRKAERHRSTAQRQAVEAAAVRERAVAHLADLEDGGD